MQTVSLEIILDTWDKDSEVDTTDPGKEIVRIPVLHAKYSRFLSAHSLASKRCSFEYSRMRKLKLEYYSGRMDADDLKKYNWEPFRFVLKSDIAAYLDADDDLTKILAKKTLHDEAVTACSAIMKELNSRTYQIKAFMDWERFINGQH